MRRHYSRLGVRLWGPVGLGHRRRLGRGLEGDEGDHVDGIGHCVVEFGEPASG